MKQRETKAVSKRTLHLDARVTQEEYDAVKKRADECGKTVSKYTRECPIFIKTYAELPSLCFPRKITGDLLQSFSISLTA